MLAIAASGMLIVALAAPGVFAQSRADRVVTQKLETTIVSFQFSDQPLEEAITFLSTLGDVNIVLDRKKVEAGKTVTLKLNDVQLLTALRLLTEQVELKFVVKDGVVYISDEEGTTLEPITVVYDVADLLTVPPNFEGPTFELQNISSGRGGGSGSSNQSIFTDEEDTSESDVAKTQEEMLEELVELIKTVVAPGTWDE
jgi:type II secretory pathway component GspD/PulD (secretin)